MTKTKKSADNIIDEYYFVRLLQMQSNWVGRVKMVALGTRQMEMWKRCGGQPSSALFLSLYRILEFFKSLNPLIKTFFKK